MVDFARLENFGCPFCEDSGTVEVSVEPGFGLASERHEAEAEWRVWRVCQCQKGEGSTKRARK